MFEKYLVKIITNKKDSNKATTALKFIDEIKPAHIKIIVDNIANWQDVSSYTWDDIKNYKWGDLKK